MPKPSKTVATTETISQAKVRSGEEYFAPASPKVLEGAPAGSDELRELQGYEGNVLAVGLVPTSVRGRYLVVRYVLRDGRVVDREVVRDMCDLVFARGRMEDECANVIEDMYLDGAS